jgi:hypothetical protein
MTILVRGLLSPLLVTGGYAPGVVVVYAAPDPAAATWAPSSTSPDPRFASWTFSTPGS